MPYSRKDRRQHADGRTGRISCHSARRTGGAPRPLGKVVLPLERWQQGPQRPQTFHDTACGDHGLQPDGTRVDSWVGRVKDDPYNEVLRENLPGVLTNEAGVICRVAADQLARQWGTTPAPPTETDPGFTKSDGRFNVSGKQPWEKLVESQYSLADDTLRLWAATPQNLRSFEQTFYSCLVAVDGVHTGLPVASDMPDTRHREARETRGKAHGQVALQPAGQPGPLAELQRRTPGGGARTPLAPSPHYLPRRVQVDCASVPHSARDGGARTRLLRARRHAERGRRGALGMGTM